MIVEELCNRIVVFGREDESVREAAKRMRDMHVGDLVVVREVSEHRVPIGIVTDRDLVIGPLADGSDVDALALGQVMNRELVTATEKEHLSTALQRMRANGIRRLPVVDEDGALQGILTMDDTLEFLDEELTQLVKLVIQEQKKEVERHHVV